MSDDSTPYAGPLPASPDGLLPGGGVELQWGLHLPFRARRAKLIIVGGLVSIFVAAGLLTHSWISVVLALAVLVVFVLPSRRRGSPATAGGGRAGPGLDFRLRLVPDDGLTLYSPAPAHVPWSDVTRVELGGAGLVITTQSGRKDVLVVPASALTPEKVAAVRAVVEASAPGRWVAETPS
jgi:hypothetical protein